MPFRRPVPTKAPGGTPEDSQVENQLQGTVDRIIWKAADSAYCVLSVLPEGRTKAVTVNGQLVVSTGSSYEFEGDWTVHPKFGRQFRAREARPLVPTTERGIELWLGSGTFPNIGPIRARTIVELWGLAAIQILEEEPERLVEIKGITPARAADIGKDWAVHREQGEVMQKLLAWGITPNQAGKLWTAYGKNAADALKDNPYQIIAKVSGFGFFTADAIARRVGIGEGDGRRAEAASVYVVEESESDGDTLTGTGIVIGAATGDLQVPRDMAPTGLQRAIDSGKLIEVSGLDAVSLRKTYRFAAGTSQALKDLRGRWDSDLSLKGMELSMLVPNQLRAVELASRQRFLAITGGPGTGKTFTQSALINMWLVNGKQVALCAPTGRAARRMQELAGHPASTIHRLIGLGPESAAHTQGNPLYADVVVVDEASMVDIRMMYYVTQALKNSAALCLIGDADQLPSIGAGDVLRDVLATEVAPTVRLTEILRQAEGSPIVTNSHRINRGEMPEPHLVSEAPLEGWAHWIEPDMPPVSAANAVETLVAERCPARGIDPKDVQVLVPMYRGYCGINALNTRLQARLNPPGPRKPEATVGKGEDARRFRVGDRVIQTRNNYEISVMNGEVGYLVDVHEGKFILEFDEREVTYGPLDQFDLKLAYAVSIHKMQGSEAPAIIIPLVQEHTRMWGRQLLYTAVTRASQLVTLVGSQKVLRRAVANDKTSRRSTLLRRMLVGEIPDVMPTVHEDEED